MLTNLSLDGNAIVDVGPLAGATALVSLTAGGNAIVELTPLAGLMALEQLTVPDNAISDITPLAAMMSLKELSLAGNPLQLGLDALAGLPVLRTIDVSATGLAQLHSFAPATLTNLVAMDNAIVDVATLLDYVKLHEVNLQGNNVTTLAPIVDASWLNVDICVSLVFSDNPLDAETVNVLIPALCMDHQVSWDGDFCMCPPQ